jgi:SAM-dependent methyltransferase
MRRETMIGALDTDSAALKERVELQERLSDFDLNEWIFSHTQPKPGEHWLDLGCGRGKQTLALAKLGCTVTSIDVSEQSLEALRKEADSLGLGDRVRTVHASLDELPELEPHDGAIGSYSLYYAKDPRALFDAIARALKDDGRLFYCGPSHENNWELRVLVSKATGKPIEKTKPSWFMESAPVGSSFDALQRFDFVNPVTFENLDDLLTYWRNHNLYDQAAEDRFAELATVPFVNRKRGMGILASKH